MADRAEIGESRRRADGKLYTKQADGTWQLAESEKAAQQQRLRQWAKSGGANTGATATTKALTTKEKVAHLMKLPPAERAAWMAASKARTEGNRAGAAAYRAHGKAVRGLTKQATGLAARIRGS